VLLISNVHDVDKDKKTPKNQKLMEAGYFKYIRTLLYKFSLVININAFVVL
jgi:hypothetical protein